MLLLLKPYVLFTSLFLKVCSRWWPYQERKLFFGGSDDRENWFPYEFKWKPGDVKKKSGFTAPHQPRLDWKMWFAALSSYERNPWLIHFMTRLLQGSPVVIALLDNNPFPDSPPRYLQAVVYDYRFTNSEVRNQNNAWWTRKLLRPYTPILMLPE